MAIELKSISRVANRTVFFAPVIGSLGFGSPGDIDRFIFSVYGKAVRTIKPAARLRGALFVLEPSSSAPGLGGADKLRPSLQKIGSESSKVLYSLNTDPASGLHEVARYTPEDRKLHDNNGWSQQVAERLSDELGKCVVWASGVGANVYVNGDLYLSSVDVIEEIPQGMPLGFQNLSWNDGAIVFEFARHELNDTSSDGVWILSDKCVLCPKPETRVRSRLGKYLRFRLATYRHHDEEPYVDNEGRADLSLHLVDGRILIVEVKWMGCSLVATKLGQNGEAIRAALASKDAGWFTRYDLSTVTSGTRQLVSYYETGKYEKAYLSVFDCNPNTGALNRYLEPDPADLRGCDPAKFRILVACVDPRPASVRAKA